MNTTNKVKLYITVESKYRRGHIAVIIHIKICMKIQSAPPPPQAEILNLSLVSYSSYRRLLAMFGWGCKDHVHFCTKHVLADILTFLLLFLISFIKVINRSANPFVSEMRS